MILLAGQNPALMEGLADSLTRSRHAVIVVATIDEAHQALGQHQPIIAVVGRHLLLDTSAAGFIQGARALGCTIVTYREEPAPDRPVTLPPDVARLVLADLELPLERTRLVALADAVSSRARPDTRVDGDVSRGTAAT